MTQQRLRATPRPLGSHRQFGALMLVLLLACMTLPAQTADLAIRADAKAPARIDVQVPHANDGAIMLELAVKALRNPKGGNAGGIVRLKGGDSGKAVEVGRFSIFPAKTFEAANEDEEKRYQFNMTQAVKELGLAGASAKVEVSLIDRGSGDALADAELVLGQTRISVR